MAKLCATDNNAPKTLTEAPFAVNRLTTSTPPSSVTPAESTYTTPRDSIRGPRDDTGVLVYRSLLPSARLVPIPDALPEPDDGPTTPPGCSSPVGCGQPPGRR